MSLVESLTNVAIGYGIAVMKQISVFPLFGLSTTLAENMAMCAISPWCRSHGRLCGGGCSIGPHLKLLRASRVITSTIDAAAAQLLAQEF